MFHVVLVSALAAFAGASRIQRVDEFKSQVKWGASCDDLQTRFHDRLVAFQASLDTVPDMDAMGRAAQARMMMRTYGIMRTLRRARTCSWVIQNDSEEIEQARDIVQSLLAGNPCAEAARSELESGLSAETTLVEISSIRRAMSILASDSCEPIAEEIEATTEGPDVDLTEAEDSLADAIATIEEDQSSLLQTDSTVGFVRGFMRNIGVAFMMVFLLLACAGAVALIGAVIGLAFGIMLELVGLCHGPDCLAMMLFPIALGMGGFVTGLGGCSYQLYTQLLPRLTQ